MWTGSGPDSGNGESSIKASTASTGFGSSTHVVSQQKPINPGRQNNTRLYQKQRDEVGSGHTGAEKRRIGNNKSLR